MAAQPIVNNYSTQQIFLGNNWDRDLTYNNTTGSAVTIAAGTVMGVIFTGGYVLGCASTASDGSQIPKGFCRETTTIPANSKGLINMVYSGEVNALGIIFSNGTDTLATNVGTEGTAGGSMLDLITAYTQCKIINSIELTIQDPNQ